MEEAKKLNVQLTETNWQMPDLAHSDALDFASEGAVHNIRANFEDSDSSIRNDSVFSVPVSIPSTRSLNSRKGEINSLLI